MTNEAGQYRNVWTEFAAHGTVNHGKNEYVRNGNATIHSNTVEGVFSHS